jgi:hypothetical protein
MKKPFILVCKPGSHQTLYEWVDDFERLGKVENIIINESKGKKKVKKHDRFVNTVPKYLGLLTKMTDAVYHAQSYV